MLLAVGLSRNLLVILALYFLALALAFFSKIPLAFFVKRVWLFIPFFTGVIALPALFITPGPVLAHLPLGLVITQTGLTTALFLLLRVGTSVSLAVLLVLTTPWNSVLKALGVLRVPAVIILILGMTYRYIHLLLHLTNDMFLSRKSRLLRRMNGPEERRLIAATSGTLLNKSLQVSSEVYLAMQIARLPQLSAHAGYLQDADGSTGWRARWWSSRLPRPSGWADKQAEDIIDGKYPCL